MKRFVKLYLEKPELASAALLVLLVVVFNVQSGGIFLSINNLRGLLGLVPEMAMVAVGVGLLMIAGEFDLSVGSMFALMPMCICVMMNNGLPFPLALFGGILIGCAAGLVNGFLTIRFAIPSFIVTLGMLFILRSLTVVVSGGFPPPFPESIPQQWFVGYVGPIRVSMFWFLALALLIGGLLSRTNFGNWIRATGGQLQAATAMGIPTARVKLGCFMLCSVIAGLAGTFQVVRLGSPLPSIGTGLELQAVAAAVVGGIALTGGIGTILGAALGAVLIRVIDNGLVITGMNANWFQAAIGALTIGAVIANSWLRRQAGRIKVET